VLFRSEVTLPALRRGRQRRDGAPENETSVPTGLHIAGPVFACVGRTAAELEVAIAGTKAQIAFYASTPAYRGVLDLHGWSDLQPQLTALSKQGRWVEMGDAIDDEMLHTFAVVGDPDSVGAGIHDRFAHMMTRATFYAPYDHDPAIWTEVLSAARQRSIDDSMKDGEQR